MNIVVWNLNGFITVLDDKDIAQEFAVGTIAFWLTTFTSSVPEVVHFSFSEPRSGLLPTSSSSR
jgi:hypothetical protein